MFVIEELDSSTPFTYNLSPVDTLPLSYTPVKFTQLGEVIADEPVAVYDVSNPSTTWVAPTVYLLSPKIPNSKLQPTLGWSLPLEKT